MRRRVSGERRSAANGRARSPLTEQLMGSFGHRRYLALNSPDTFAGWLWIRYCSTR